MGVCLTFEGLEKTFKKGLSNVTLVSKKGILLMRVLVFFAFCMALKLAADPLQERNIESIALISLAKDLGISIKGNFAENLQKPWRRNGRLERWEIPEVAISDRELVIKWAKEHGMMQAWSPTRKVYDKAVIFGASTPQMELRLAYLVQLWNEGVRFNEVFWITGKRPLDVKVDAYMDEVANETGAARVIWEYADLPKEMRKVPITFLSTPARKTMKRAGSRDVVQDFADKVSDPGTLLFVSTQPFCGYQCTIIKSILSSSIDFDVVGPSFPETHPQAGVLILDTLARWLSEEFSISKEGK